MLESSKDGVQLLRALALAVRSEQDFDLVPRTHSIVGALKSEGAQPSDAVEAKQRGGLTSLLRIKGYVPLNLRGALNKIAHADPRRADYYFGPGNLEHDLLLFGTDRGRDWFAAVWLPELVHAIRSLPDAAFTEP